MSVPQNPGPAGWHADPQGSPGALRWWDGKAWTDLAMAPPGSSGSPPRGGATPAGGPTGSRTDATPNAGPSGTMTLTRPASEPDSADPGPVDDGAGGRLPPPLRRRFRILLGGLGALALVLVVLVASGAFEATTATEPGDSGAVGAPAPPPSTDPKDALVRIVDPDAGISYAYLGVGWKEWDDIGYSQDEMSSVHGQYIVTQELVPEGGQFIAQVTSGPLADYFGPASAGTFPSAIGEVADSVRGKYYPQPHESDPVEEGPLTIDGHQAYQARFDLSWDVEGYESTGERVCLLLIDTGKPRPALMYISIPDTHGEMYSIVDDVIASIRVDA